MYIMPNRPLLLSQQLPDPTIEHLDIWGTITYTISTSHIWTTVTASSTSDTDKGSTIIERIAS